MSRLPRSYIQRARAVKLTKDAIDALNCLAEERLNLDSESRQALDDARQAVSVFDYAISQQPAQDKC